MKPGHNASQRFCLLTTGRSGSTALMDAFAAVPGTAVPRLDVDCRDHELLHPKAIQGYAAEYSRLLAVPVTTADALIEAFYTRHAHARRCGFKSMPNRHRDFAAFSARDDIQFITLTREDTASTVASFMLAMEQGSWRRAGGIPGERWTLTRRNAARVASNLAYVSRANRVLLRVPGAIHLGYEALCSADFQDPRLDAFFGCHIALSAPKPPTRGESYVTNWQAFVDFLKTGRLAESVPES